MISKGVHKERFDCIKKIFQNLFFVTLFSYRRKGLAFIDLKAPQIVTKKVTRNSKWECGAVEWNPHLSHAHIFANAVSV